MFSFSHSKYANWCFTFGPLFTILGSIFRIQHWPGGILSIYIGLGIIAAGVLLNVFTKPKIKVRSVLSAMAILIFLLSYSLKIQHLPGHRILLGIAFICALLWAILYLWELAKSDSLRMNFRRILFYLGCALICLGTVLKIQHLPGAYPIITCGLCAAVISYLLDIFSAEK